MAEALALLVTPAFYAALGLVFPLVSGLLSAAEIGLARLELGVRTAREPSWIWHLIFWALGRIVDTWNHGPRTLGGWGLLLLSLAAIMVAAGCAGPDVVCGHSWPPSRPASLAQIQQMTAQWCLSEAAVIDHEVLDPEAHRVAQREHATYCDVLLSMLPHQLPRQGDNE